jgi:hypothetical protein
VAIEAATAAGTKACVTMDVLNEKCKFGKEYSEKEIFETIMIFVEENKADLSWENKSLLMDVKKRLIGCDGNFFFFFFFFFFIFF